MASRYCTANDVRAHGPRGGFPNPGRLAYDVDVATEVLTLDGHGFATDDELVFRAEGGGSLPAPLVAGTTYYAIPLTDSTFQVAASAGGAAIDLTTAGTGIIVTSPLPFDRVIEWASAEIDEQLPAHVVPLEAPYPRTVVSAAATIAAAHLLRITGGAALDQIAEIRRVAQRDLDRWTKARPIRGAVVPPAANLAAVAVTSATDPLGWIPDEGRLP